MRVLIIGGAGFIGLHLARDLVGRGMHVDLLDDFSRGADDPELSDLSSRPQLTMIRRSLLQDGTVDALDTDYDLIFHLAAIVGVQNVLKRPYDTLYGNTALTDAAIRLGQRQKALRRLVFTSTSEIYAGTGEKGDLPVPTPETTPLILPDLDSARTSYMLSKLVGESMCFYSGLPVTILRPHNVYGPRMGLSHVIPQMLERAHKARDGEEFQVWSADHTRTFCYIDDAVAIMRRAAEADSCLGKAINLGSQRPEITIGELAAIVLRVVGRRLTPVSMPPHPGSPARRCPDMSLTRDLIGFEAGIELEDGVRRTYEWYRTNIF